MLISSHYRPIENGFWGLKRGGLPPGKNDPPPGTNLPPKHIFGCIERQATLLMISCRCVEGTKKYIFLYIKKTSGDNFTHTPRHAPFLIATNFGTWGQVTDVINWCQLLSKSVQGLCPPQGGRNLSFSIDLMHRSYNSVSTINCSLY